MELVDRAPAVNVEGAEYVRLLGYPRGRVLEGRARELAEWARAWYAEHGRPWIYAREAAALELGGDSIRIDGAEFASPRLVKMLADAHAEKAVLVAVSAGPELEEEARRLWESERPDEYFFLEVFGSAVVEHLAMTAGARLCDRAEPHGMGVLPHYSPGYPEWDIAEQPRLLRLMEGLPGELTALESGALRPKKSLLAVFGVARRTGNLRSLRDLTPCENCSLAACQYRRAAYRRVDAPYRVNARALQRWATDRLTLTPREDGGFDALFRYDGTTCTNTGQPLAFQYRVRLGPREEGFPIREQHCAPAPGDEGHMHMCQYIRDGAVLLSQIEDEKPLLGRPLREVLTWERATSPAGCYCEPESREHKWGLVLETIHWALSR